MVKTNEFIETSSLFKNCTINIDDYIVRTYQKGEILSHTINKEKVIGFIKSGNVDVYTLGLDASEVKLNKLSSGDCFGICNLYSDDALTTILKCCNKTEVLYFPKKTILRMAEKDPQLMHNYNQLCNNKIQFLLNKIELFTIQSTQRKIISYLFLNANSENRVTLSDSKESLAKELAMSRASLFKELSVLQKENLISVDSKTIIILDKEKLIRKL